MGRHGLSRILRQRRHLPRRVAATRGASARRAGSRLLARSRQRERRTRARRTGIQRIRKGMSRKMLIKPFRSIESAATATHNWRPRQILRAGASTLVLGLVAPRLAWASSVLGVRVWPARDYTRVTIESDQPLQNTQQLLQGPDRLVVDLNGLDLDQALKDLVSKIAPNDPQIQSVRVGQYQPHVVRMVFDLKGSVKPQVFALTPVGSYKYRLVFDLYPAVAPDPLMDLLAQTERKQQRLDDANPNPSPPPATLSAPATPPKVPPQAADDNTDAFFQKYAQTDDLPS